jgi:thioredoxin reductase (NADPH)
MLEESVRANPKIKLYLEQTVEEIKGDKKVESITIKHKSTGELTELSVAGVFAAVGVLPHTKLVEGQLKLTESGHIDCGEDCRTEIGGVFAAGDLRSKPLYQIVTACADGAVAATEANRLINE